MKKVNAFEIVECQGTPYEIGRQWGEGCRDSILKAMDMTFGGLSFVHHTTQDNIIANATKLVPKVANFDPDLIDLLKGQAAGAGVGFQEVFALKCGFDLGAYYQQLTGLCTSFAVTGAAARNGRTLLGQNIDWLPGTPMDLVRITHQDGSRQLSLVLWGIVEYTLSSAGFGMCANGTWAAADNYLANLPIGCYLPKAMRQKSLADALAVLRSTARGLGYYHLASAGKEMSGIESIQEDYEIIDPEKDVLVHANHYLTERFKKADLVNIVVPDSLQRVERIKRLINEHYGRITVDTMQAILADHQNYPYSICRHINEADPYQSATLASYIMAPEDRMMYIAYGNPCESAYLEYNL